MVDQEQQGHNLYQHLAAEDPHTQYVLESVYNTLGNLVSGDDDGPVVLVLSPLDQNGFVLSIDRSVPGGVRWRYLDAIPISTIHARGDLAVGSSALSIGRLPVGIDGQVLMADSSQALGVKWGDVASICPNDLDFSVECNSGYVSII